MATPSVLPDAVSRKGSADRLQGVLLLFTAAILAFLLYRPDTNAPFEIIDFSETLPFLTEGRDFGERFTGLVGYYLQHGRAAFALSAGLAAKWTLFEWWTPGWQWTRFVVGLSVVVLAWHLLRALGANRAGASVGAALFIVSETAAPGWLRPAVNEPFGTLLLLAASLLACRYQATEHPARFAMAIAFLLAMMILVKETLIAATFFPVVLALCLRPDGVLARPTRSARNVRLVVSSAVAIAVTAVPVLWALTQTAPDGYARQFGGSESLISNAIFGVLPALIPFTPVSQPPGWAATVADVTWLVLLAAGLRLSSSADPATKRHARMLAGTALALPLARLIVYLPWPLQFPYYSIPFLTGVAIIAAIGVTRLTRYGGTRAAIATLCAAAVILFAGSNAYAQSSRYFALRRLTDGLVERLHSLGRDGGLQEVVIGVPRAKQQAWTGLGPTLSRFAVATGSILPPVREIPCAEVGRLTAPVPHRIAITALQHHCPLVRPSGMAVSELAWRVDFRRLRPVADTVRAWIFVNP